MDCVVAPFDHKYDCPELAVSVTVLPVIIGTVPAGVIAEDVAG